MPDLPSFRGMGGRLRALPAQWTTDADAGHTAEVRRAISRIAKAADYAAELDQLNGGDGTSDAVRIIREIRDRKAMLEPEQARLRSLFRRWDNLFNPQDITTGGPDHWSEEVKPGRVHISINTPPVYVTIPASMEGQMPVENYVPATGEIEDREKAARAEELYFEWKDEIDFELLINKACIVKRLYGFTYLKVFWDAVNKRPGLNVIDSPENLYVGWGASDFSRMDWALYCYGLSPQAIEEDYGLSVEAMKEGDDYFPMVTTGDHTDPIGSVFKQPGEQRSARNPSAYEQMQTEVYDYWYKKPKGRGKRPEIWNALYVGNHLVVNAHHGEFEEIPYIPLPNTYEPGSPYGRSEFHDLEQLFREKDERMTNAGQMLASITEGQMWQLVGPEAPEDVPANAVPRANKVAAPGPGSELKALQPFVPEYASEDFLKRLDLELERRSGLNELLLGQAPLASLGSSKAVSAIVANYETRIALGRQILYGARKAAWRMAAMAWERKDPKVKAIIGGRYRLDVQPPELTPRDKLETASVALNLLQNRAWSLRRVMDATGVENPEDEIAIIREEQTDAALNPAAVTQQATLLGTMQSLGIQPPNASVDQAQNAARTLNRPISGGQSLNAPENQSSVPNEAVPANAQAPNGSKAVLQSMTANGETSGRILTQTPITGGGGG